MDVLNCIGCGVRGGPDQNQIAQKYRHDDTACRSSEPSGRRNREESTGPAVVWFFALCTAHIVLWDRRRLLANTTGWADSLRGGNDYLESEIARDRARTDGALVQLRIGVSDNLLCSEAREVSVLSAPLRFMADEGHAPDTPPTSHIQPEKVPDGLLCLEEPEANAIEKCWSRCRSLEVGRREELQLLIAPEAWDRSPLRPSWLEVTSLSSQELVLRMDRGRAGLLSSIKSSCMLSQAVMRAPHSSTISTATERARPYPTPYRPELRREEDDMPIHRLLFPLDKSLDRRRSYCAVTRFDAFAEGGSEPFTIPPAPPSPSSSSAESLYESASAESPEKAVDEHEPEHIRQEEQVAEIQAQEEQASGSGVDLAPKTPLGDTWLLTIGFRLQISWRNRVIPTVSEHPNNFLLPVNQCHLRLPSRTFPRPVIPRRAFLRPFPHADQSDRCLRPAPPVVNVSDGKSGISRIILCGSSPVVESNSQLQALPLRQTEATCIFILVRVEQSHRYG
ncbi:hypothetical protein BV25DRAFT_1835161 [Artomyces pyxidatus]|uniref:Uncharacterized protein n=1 Tax=Artomyces pyxidatus TaxID=48021 RepID=A0ACB8TGJ3_9AGAM|nr:hypothetical protein BV25DRAFT_1835161 [Artomyces pyxidatus]